jgi:hypothetical protein
MHVDTTCPGCQRKLRVPAESAGGTARCPICNTIFAPQATSPPAVEPQDRWRLKTPEGLEYGPVARTVLDGWVAEGRVSDNCSLLCEQDGVWRGAAEVYAVLRPAPVAVPATQWYEARPTTESTNPTSTARQSPRVLNPDRGGIVLALGILSWAVGCPVFGILAWVMGNNDLSEMRQGSMDRRGQGMTEAGRLVGMLHVILSLIVLFIGIFLVLFWGVLQL